MNDERSRRIGVIYPKIASGFDFAGFCVGGVIPFGVRLSASNNASFDAYKTTH
jgi:hypothetical protein